VDQDDRFRTTKWSVVLSARARGEPGSKAALTQLCESYWYPLYVFVRRRGYGSDEALDLTQGYFLQLIERDYLKNVRPEAGKFRSFLLATLKHHISHETRRERTLRRGGGSQVISLDATAADQRYSLEPRDPRRTPDQDYERQWARAAIRHARERLERELDESGKGRQFRVLAQYLSGDGERPYREVAAELETTEAAVKMAVPRLRRRYGRILREEIAQTVDAENEVEDEIRYLLAAIHDA